MMPHIIDPFLMHGWAMTDATASIQAWFQSSGLPNLVITAVLHQRHCIPLVVHFLPEKFEVAHLRTSLADEESVQHLVNMIASAFSQIEAEVVPISFEDPTPSCGAHAVAFIRHMWTWVIRCHSLQLMLCSSKRSYNKGSKLQFKLVG